jgi:1-acyl-sn-glycerol-3-phosphate acyltransferase
MTGPRLNQLGCALPVAWQQAILRRARGLDVAALLSDLFLDYPPNRCGMDPVLTKRLWFLIEQLAGRYFRLTTMGRENLPQGRAVLLACHSGVVPWDATLLAPEIYRLTGRFSWNAGHDLWGRYAWLRDALASTGMVLGRRPPFEELLERDEMVLIFADGGQGNRRAYYLESDRYKIKPDKGFAPGRGGYVKLAIRTRSPIVPVAIVGTEEIHYCLGDIPQLARWLDIPFAPLVGSLLPLPARVYIRFGTPIRLDVPPAAADDQDFVDRANEHIRAAFQGLVDDTLAHRKGIYWSSYDAGDGRGAPPTRRAPILRLVLPADPPRAAA